MQKLVMRGGGEESAAPKIVLRPHALYYDLLKQVQYNTLQANVIEFCEKFSWFKMSTAHNSPNTVEINYEGFLSDMMYGVTCYVKQAPYQYVLIHKDHFIDFMKEELNQIYTKTLHTHYI